jgi:molybdenum cofactor cytidylyltransferase
MSDPCVLVLASGRGDRFIASGGEGSKLRAMLGGKTVLDHTLDAVRASGLQFHVEDQGHAGMGDSIAAAVRATQHAGGWLILPGDLPLVRPESLRAVAAALAAPLASHAVVAPYYQGQRGHPVGFGVQCRDALLTLHGPEGAQRVLREQAALSAPLRLDLDDEGNVTDIDTVSDLIRARALLSSRKAPPAA